MTEVERRIVHVLFADLVGFTTLSERLDAEDVATIQNAYFDAVRDTVGRYRGQLEKFVGDAAMAVFGIPVARDDDAERAVRAGLALVSAVEQVGARLGLPEHALRVRVGVNGGEAVTGEATPERGPVTGDMVNVAARLQGVAPAGRVLVGPVTALAVADAIELEDAGGLELKGKTQTIRASLVRGAYEKRSRDYAMGSLRAPTLGRDDELALLREAFARTRRGACERIVVAAPPGVGKTRLVEEFATSAVADAAVWRARLRADIVAPYDAVAQILSGAGASADKVRADLEAGGMSSSRAAVVADAVGALVDARTHGEQRADVAEREAVFAAWIAALDALAGGASVWIVEDVHWAGPDLLAFLDHAGDGDGGGPGRLVLATTRPALLERAGEWCAASRLLDLRPLAPAAADRLVRALVGAAVPERLVERIVERSDGNPLFIEELLRTWISIGLLVEDGAGWTLVAEADDVVLPPSVQAIYGAQLDDLPPRVRSVARRASVAGRRFAVPMLAPLGIDDPKAELETLRARALIAGPVRDRLLGESFAFRHALLRDAGYASLTRGERARLHVLLARWLESAAGEQWPQVAETIAHHYATAAETAPTLLVELVEGLDRAETEALAAKWFERAGEAALEIAAHEAARDLFRRALSLTPDEAVRERARRLRRLGEITAHTADMAEGARILEQALELLDAGGPAGDRRLTAASLADVYFEQLRFADSRDVIEQALAAGTAEDEGTARLLIGRGVATVALTNDIEAAYLSTERAGAIAEHLGDEALGLDAVSWLAHIHTFARAALQRTDWRAVERRAREQRRWRLVAAASEARALVALSDDRPRDALTAAAELEETAAAHALTELLSWVDYIRTEALFAAGDLEAALAAGLRGLELAERNAYHRVVIRIWMAALPAAAALGRRDVGARLAEWHDARRGRLPDSPFSRLAQASFEVNRARLGLPAQPVPEPEHLLPAFALRFSQGSLAVQRDDVVSAWLDRGEVAGARAAAEQVQRHVAEQSPSTQAATKVLWARVAAAEGRDDANALAAEALETFRALGHRWWIGTTEALLARVAANPVRAGQRRPAREPRGASGGCSYWT